MNGNILLLLDGSGSMATKIDETVRGVNSYIRKMSDFVKENLEFKDLKIKVVIWDNERYETVISCDVIECPELYNSNYIVGGLTPLMDVVCKGALELKSIDSEKKILVVMTDGFENDSCTYNQNDVTEMIKDIKSSGGEVIFLGADIDEWHFRQFSTSIGVSEKSTISYNSIKGTMVAFSDTSRGTIAYLVGSEGKDEKPS